MISISITRYNPVQSTKKQKVKVGSEEHKRYIHSRCLKQVEGNDNYKLNTKCIFEGHACVVIGIVTEFEHVKWEGLRCQFIEVFDDDEEEENKWFKLAHPSQLFFGE